MHYEKSLGVGGEWVKKAEVRSGSKAKLVSECQPYTKDYGDGPKTQQVAKVKIQGDDAPKNLALNRATLNALIDAFGDDSKDWIGHTLTVQTEKVIVGGKRGVAMYLVPPGFKMTEDEDGYVVIQPEEKKEENDIVPDIDPADIPFD